MGVHEKTMKEHLTNFTMVRHGNKHKMQMHIRKTNKQQQQQQRTNHTNLFSKTFHSDSKHAKNQCNSQLLRKHNYITCIKIDMQSSNRNTQAETVQRELCQFQWFLLLFFVLFFQVEAVRNVWKIMDDHTQTNLLLFYFSFCFGFAVTATIVIISIIPKLHN